MYIQVTTPVNCANQCRFNDYLFKQRSFYSLDRQRKLAGICLCFLSKQNIRIKKGGRHGNRSRKYKLNNDGCF